jgi:hypothetical protein
MKHTILINAIKTVIRVFALTFMVAFTIEMCYIYLVAVMQGGSVTIYTNLFGEQQTELWIIAWGLACMCSYVPHLVRDLAQGKP